MVNTINTQMLFITINKFKCLFSILYILIKFTLIITVRHSKITRQLILNVNTAHGNSKNIISRFQTIIRFKKKEPY